MQKVIYLCDGCGREIGKKKHVSLFINTNQQASGIAVPPAKSGPWAVSKFKQYFVHFHNGKCAGLYFDKILAATNPLMK